MVIKLYLELDRRKDGNRMIFLVFKIESYIVISFLSLLLGS